MTIVTSWLLSVYALTRMILICCLWIYLDLWVWDVDLYYLSNLLLFQIILRVRRWVGVVVVVKGYLAKIGFSLRSAVCIIVQTIMIRASLCRQSQDTNDLISCLKTHNWPYCHSTIHFFLFKVAVELFKYQIYAADLEMVPELS